MGAGNTEIAVVYGPLRNDWERTWLPVLRRELPKYALNPDSALIKGSTSEGLIRHSCMSAAALCTLLFISIDGRKKASQTWCQREVS